MDLHNHGSGDDRPRDPNLSAKLSYKFQRLRERLRTAIASGELSGKLPGERQLARKFHVNAKTLSKALTDLAAEGLLDRSIGRGTFVKGADTPAPPVTADRWLVICDRDQLTSGVVEHLKQLNPAIQVVTDIATLRPSFLNPIKAVIDLSPGTPDTFLRDMVVRNMTVVLVGREPRTYSVNAVLVDRALGSSILARDMMLSGHRRFVAVEHRGQTAVADAIRRAAQRYAPDSVVESVFAADVANAVEQFGATAVICDTRRAASQVRDILARRNISIPQRVSLAALGSGPGDFPCSGYFVHSRQKAETVAQLIRESNLKRPTTLWLTGAFVDRATIAAPESTPPHLLGESQERSHLHFASRPTFE
jgi:DNA-binding transcriptional regulator YhcF (GntR family)